MDFKRHRDPFREKLRARGTIPVRRLATRYDKTHAMYLGGLLLVSILIFKTEPNKGVFNLRN